MYAKRLGYEVVLHTDNDGLELLKGIGYDRIELSLNELNKGDLTFWSLGKIRALELEGVNNIHIDGDVFLKSKKIKTLFESNYDVLVQMIDAKESFTSNYLPQLNLLNSITNLHLSNVKHSYNCGILGFKDEQLFSEYTELVKKLVSIYKKNTKINKIYANEFKFYEKMLIVEQYTLSSLVDKLGKKPSFVINQEDNVNTACHNYGFVHALGVLKYADSFQELVKKRIKDLENEGKEVSTNSM